MVDKYRMHGQTPNTASIHTVHVVRVALFLSYTAYRVFLVVEAMLCSLRLAVLCCPVDALWPSLGSYLALDSATFLQSYGL